MGSRRLPVFFPVDGLAQLVCDGPKGGGLIGTGESLQVAFVGGIRDLDPAMEVGNTLTHGAPIEPFLAAAFPQDLEVARIVDGGLHSEVGALLVVELDVVGTYSMLDPDALGPFF